MNQKERIVKFFKDFGSISSWEAYQELGITQLGARIFELEKMGYAISRKTETNRNRYGQQVQYQRYFLVNEPEK